MTGLEVSRTRDQRVVECLAEELPPDPGKLEAVRARARSLPAMLRRHGLLQVLLFLDSHATERPADGQLARWLVSGITTALGQKKAGDPAEYAARLAGTELFNYLLCWETAVEVAGWLKMLVEARCAPRGQQRQTEGTP
jgi:hypothetical protein